MSTAVLPIFVTEEEYLTNPRYKHCEYVDGQVVPPWLILDEDGSLPEPETAVHVGNKRHSRLQFVLSTYVGNYLLAHPVGRGATELRCALSIRGKTIFRLPDLAVVLGDDLDEEHYYEGAPVFVVEVRSPDQRLSVKYRKMQEYLDGGAKMGWLVLPENQSIIVFLPGGVTQAFGLGETVTGGDVLPGFELLIDELF